MLQVRPFCPPDVAFAAQMSDLEGWDASAQDYESLFHFQPQGCFTGHVGGERVGVVLTIAYGKLGWISTLVVRREARGLGYGSALLSRAVAYLFDQGVRTVGLDATPQTLDLYLHAGFTPAYDLVYSRRAALPPPAALAGPIVPLKPRNLHAVAMFDWASFGSSREQVLRGLLQLSPVACLAQDESGVAGYVLARAAREHWTIGPWVCTRLAEALLTHALEGIGAEPVHVGTPAVNEDALRLLGDYGFQEYYRETRMFQGDPEGIGRPEHVYGIASAEKG